MSGLIFRLPGLFTDLTIPKLYRDKVITAGTKYCFDSKDAYSFPRQAAPVPGVDVWKNLLDGGPFASFTGGIGFDTGFKFFTADGDYINLPASGIVPENADAMLVIIWVKLGTPAPSGGAAVFNAGSSYAATNNQYALTWLNGALRFHVGGWQSNAMAAADVVPAAIHQFAMSMNKRASDGKYDLTTFADGLARQTNVSSFTSIPQPSGAQWLNPYIGRGPAYEAAGWDGAVYRTLYDDCSVKSAAELVALDYAENQARITGGS